MHFVSDESVGAQEVVFSFDASNLAHGCANMQLLILSSLALMQGWSLCPVREGVVGKGFNIKLVLPRGAKVFIPVCLVQDGEGTASTTHTLVACWFGDIDRDWEGGDVIDCDGV